MIYGPALAFATGRLKSMTKVNGGGGGGGGGSTTININREGPTIERQIIMAPIHHAAL